MKIFLKLFFMVVLISVGWNFYNLYNQGKIQDEIDQEKQTKLNLLIKEASSGDPEKEFQVALAYADMEATTENRQKLLYWLERSAQKGFSKAITEYMQIMIIQLRDNPESVKAEKLKSIAGPLAQKGDSQAQFVMYLLSTMSLFDEKKGLEFLDASAKQNFVPALIDTAKILMRGEDTPDSRGLSAGFYIDKALKVDPENTDAKLLLGMEYLNEGKFSKLLEVFNDDFLNSIQDKKSQLVAYHIKGSVLYEMGEWDDAIKYSKQAVEMGDKQSYLTLFFISYRSAENLRDSISRLESDNEKDEARKKSIELFKESKDYVDKIKSDPKIEQILVDKVNRDLDTLKDDIDFKIELIKK